jgi:hypothetical protein
MINKENNSVEWSGLMYELEDASEHLKVFISEMEMIQSLMRLISKFSYNIFFLI